MARIVDASDRHRRKRLSRGAAAEEGSAFVPFMGSLDDVLCVQGERVVGHDDTVRYEGRVLQIPEQRHRLHVVKAGVQVHAYPEGRLTVLHGPRRLADYEPDTHRYGPEAPRPRASSPGPVGAGHQAACCAIRTTSCAQPSRSRSRCRRRYGARSRGVRARPTGSPRASPVYGSGRHTATTTSANSAQRKGCWWRGPLRRRSRRSTGFRR